MLALAAQAGPSPSLIVKGPYLQAPGPGAMCIKWESPTNSDGTVRFGTRGRTDQRITGIQPRQLTGVTPRSATNIALITTNGMVLPKTNVTSVLVTNTFYLYEATLTNLDPATEYGYRVEFQGELTPLRKFKPISREAPKVRFIAYGDSRSYPADHASVTRQFLKYAPEFVLHTGDLVAKGRNYSLWSREFFQPLAGVIDRVPIYPSLGNHEEDGTNYLAYFRLPGMERWYAFDVGPVHVLALDFHFEDASHEQFRFASNDLMNARAPWKIVVLHYPIFNIGGHGTGWGHTNYLPLFHRAKVDLVLGGHSHIYERFRPVAGKGPDAQWPIIGITTGGGGAPLYPDFDHPAIVSHKSAHHFLVFDATPDLLTGETIQADGKTIDRFELRRRDDRPPSGDLAVYPEESLKLFFELSACLTGRAAAIPTATESADVMLTVPPRKKSANPAELEIGLAAESARYYRLDGPAVRISTPARGTTNTVWVKVRATGTSKVTGGKEKELSPPLVFKANAKAEEGETIVYGSNTKQSQAAADALKQR